MTVKQAKAGKIRACRKLKTRGCECQVVRDVSVGGVNGSQAGGEYTANTNGCLSMQSQVVQ